MSDTAAKVAELGYVSMKFCPLSKLSVSSGSRGIHPAIKEDAKYISFNGRSTHFYFLEPKSKSFKKKKVPSRQEEFFMFVKQFWEEDSMDIYFYCISVNVSNESYLHFCEYISSH